MTAQQLEPNALAYELGIDACEVLAFFVISEWFKGGQKMVGGKAELPKHNACEITNQIPSLPASHL